MYSDHTTVVVRPQVIQNDVKLDSSVSSLETIHTFRKVLLKVLIGPSKLLSNNCTYKIVMNFEKPVKLGCTC